LPGTLYHFRAVAVNSAALIAGADLTFTTPSISPPALQQSILLPSGALSFTFTTALARRLLRWHRLTSRST
jgi:hypothetical protein